MLLMLRSYILYMYFNLVKYDFIKLVCTYILPSQSYILKEAPMRISQVNDKELARCQGPPRTEGGSHPGESRNCPPSSRHG